MCSQGSLPTARTMTLSRLARGCLLICTLTAGSAGCRAPASTQGIDRLSSINLAGISSRVVYSDSSGATAGLQSVRTEDESASLQVVTPAGVVWISPSGDVQRRVSFATAPSGGLAPVVRLSDDRSDFFAGCQLHLSGGDVVFFDIDGRELARHPSKMCFDMVAAALDSARPESLVVRAMGGSGATVFERRGAVARTLNVAGYLTALSVVRYPGDVSDSLAFQLSPDPELGRAVRIVDATGRERAKWRIAAHGYLRGFGVGSALALDGDAVVEFDVRTGVEVSRAIVEGASAFRHLRAAPWRDGWSVMVLSGHADLDRHMVVVIDARGQVVYREVGPGRSFTLCAPPGSNAFYVGVGADLKRYTAP